MSTFEIVVRVGSIAGLFSFAYLVADNRRRRPTLKYTHESRFGEAFERDGMSFFRWTFEGILKNQSPEPNTVARIHLVAWRDRRLNDTLRYGWGAITVLDRGSDRSLPLPIALAPRDAKAVRIQCEFPVTGTHEAILLVPSIGSPPVDYQVCFEDVAENVFDMHGKRTNPIERDLRWTRPNAVARRREGHRFALLRHDFAIIRTRGVFRLASVARMLGLLR